MTPGYARLCLPVLAALMLRDGHIDPRRFTPETFADPSVAALAARVAIRDDGNPDPNALSPQRLAITLSDGTGAEYAIPATLGAPDAPLSPEQAAAKRDLARALAPQADPGLFDDPLAWFCGRKVTLGHTDRATSPSVGSLVGTSPPTRAGLTAGHPVGQDN
jgi:hypothetical protein